MLFYGGAAFAFFVVLPMVFEFFAQVAPAGVTFMPDINSYLDFMVAMVFAFGLAFQVPIAIIIIVWTGLVSRKTLAAGRPYVFLGAFVFGMLLTPPDVFSQTLLAVPMYALFEAALFFCARFIPVRGGRMRVRKRGEGRTNLEAAVDFRIAGEIRRDRGRVMSTISRSSSAARSSRNLRKLVENSTSPSGASRRSTARISAT